MNNAIFSLAISLAVAGLTAAAPSGQILILDNEQLIEGDIHRDGERYVIRRGAGETIIPAQRVIDVVADRQQAYQVMRERCNRRDFDDRMRLVRWCLENGLREQALAEAEPLHQFRPDDQRLRGLVEGLRTLTARKFEPPPAQPSAKQSDKVLDVEPLDYNRESFGLFNSRVQPILMNACARCHASGQGGNYVLAGVNGGDRKATLANLAATLKQLKKSDLAASPLLLKAITPHGLSAQPPLRGRQSPAYEYLESWVQLAVVPEEAAPATPPFPMDVANPAVVDAGTAIVGAKPIMADARPVVLDTKPLIPEPRPAPKATFGEVSTSQARPEPQTEAKDPFDPAIFNGTIQPKK